MPQTKENVVLKTHKNMKDNGKKTGVKGGAVRFTKVVINTKGISNKTKCKAEVNIFSVTLQPNPCYTSENFKKIHFKVLEK